MGRAEEESQDREVVEHPGPAWCIFRGQRAVYLDQKVQLRSQQGGWIRAVAISDKDVGFYLNKMKSQEGL